MVRSIWERLSFISLDVVHVEHEVQGPCSKSLPTMHKGKCGIVLGFVGWPKKIPIWV